VEGRKKGRKEGREGGRKEGRKEGKRACLPCKAAGTGDLDTTKDKHMPLNTVKSVIGEGDLPNILMNSSFILSALQENSQLEPAEKISHSCD
jgi:predicted transposase YdaD